GHRHDAVEVLVFAAEQRVRLDLDREHEVAVRPSARADVPPAREAHAVAVPHARRDLDVEPLAGHDPAGRAAARARTPAEVAGPAALGAAAGEEHGGPAAPPPGPGPARPGGG